MEEEQVEKVGGINEKIDGQNLPYTVLLPVYHGDSPSFLKVAIDSMLSQTMPPEEILIAIDGKVGEELQNVIHDYTQQNSELFSVYQYERNEGLGALLQKTVPLCRNEYIARMDADDYSVPERIRKQMKILQELSDVGIVGCNVDEFEDDMNFPAAHVILPEKPEENYKFAKRRCPMRHSALLYKKTDVIKAGNYISMFSLEDYDLIVRMLCRGVRLYNIQEPLVFVRISRNFYRRRGGVQYVKCMIKMKIRFLKMGFMSFFDFLISCGGQIFVVLMPGWFREWFYIRFLRNR